MNKPTDRPAEIAPRLPRKWPLFHPAPGETYAAFVERKKREDALRALDRMRARYEDAVVDNASCDCVNLWAFEIALIKAEVAAIVAVSRDARSELREGIAKLSGAVGGKRIALSASRHKQRQKFEIIAAGIAALRRATRQPNT